MSIFEELKRRNVYRAATAYVVVAWLVIQVADVVFSAFGLGETAVRIVIILLSIGFIPAVVSAWAFELTPRGLVRESEIDRTSLHFQKTGRRIDRLVMVVLAFAVGFFLLDRLVFQPQRETAIEEMAREAGGDQVLAEVVAERADRSLVVLPFVDMSQNQDQEYFADGLAEELMILLARIPELRVISRTSAFAFKNKKTGLSEIARQLNVAHVLEGSVRVDGTRIRVTAQLINAREDIHLWAQSFDRDLTEVFSIQDEVAELVVRQLEIDLLGKIPLVERTDPEAYRLYLQSKSYAYKHDSFAFSVAKLEQALAIDPQFVVAWVQLGRLLNTQVNSRSIEASEGIERAWSAADNALHLDPYYAPAHALMGSLKIAKNDLPGSVGHFQRAVELAPGDPDVLFPVSVLLKALGRFDESQQVVLFLLERDPFSQQMLLNLALNRMSARRLDEAEIHFQSILSSNPDTLFANPYYGLTLLLNGKHQEALQVIKSLDGFLNKWGMLLYYQKLGMNENFEAGLEEIKEMEGNKPSPNFFQFYASLGMVEAAFKRAIPKSHFPHDRHLPSWWPIVNDPRWQKLLESMGCSDDQIKNIKFDLRMPRTH